MGAKKGRKNGFAEPRRFRDTVVAGFARIQTDFRSRAEFLQIQLQTCSCARQERGEEGGECETGIGGSRSPCLNYRPSRASPQSDREAELLFAQFLENLAPLGDLARILAGLGFITVLLAILKRNGERRCWRNFKVRVTEWTYDVGESERRRLPDLDDEGKAECERMLWDSKFSPLEINQVLDTSVIVAKGIAAEKFFM
jgi:hypothetical protein